MTDKSADRDTAPHLSNRYQRALFYAFQLHRRQSRKGTTTPYIAHLLTVSALVLEHGGDEDTAIAALLHDAVEDQGGLPVLETIRNNFGDRVARLVEACSDTLQTPKPPWQERKATVLRQLEEADPDVLLISLADKIHNARSIVSDFEKVGDQLWARFHGGKEGTLWYYRACLDVLTRRGRHPFLLRQLRRLVHAMESACVEHSAIDPPPGKKP